MGGWLLWWKRRQVCKTATLRPGRTSGFSWIWSPIETGSDLLKWDHLRPKWDVCCHSKSDQALPKTTSRAQPRPHCLLNGTLWTSGRMMECRPWSYLEEGQRNLWGPTLFVRKVFVHTFGNRQDDTTATLRYTSAEKKVDLFIAFAWQILFNKLFNNNWLMAVKRQRSHSTPHAQSANLLSVVREGF